MYIVRWLMSHPIVAIWVLLGIAILFVFGSGGDKDDIIGSTVTAQLEEVEVIERSSEKEAVAVSETDDSSMNTNETLKIDSMPSSVTSLEAKSDITENNPEQTSNPKSVETKGTATADLSQLSGEEMLLMAREAYWNNGLDEAAQIYTKLIEIEPKILEHKGELGNVFWRQGHPKKAAELYSEIAIPMIENGNSERVANMIGFIGLFYPDRAALIHQTMQSNLGTKGREADKLIEVGTN